MSVFLSVVICTHNRRASVLRTLASLTRLTPPSVPWEVVVVANACQDGTVEACQQYLAAGRLPGRVVSESRQGVAHARNRAVLEARAEFLIFADDDVTFAPAYLQTYVRAEAAYPDVAMFAGRIIARWPTAHRPWWYPKPDQWPVDGVAGSFHPQDGEGPTTQLPFEANMALRKQVLAGTQPFPVELGMNGRQVGFGEGPALFERLRKAGHRLVYLPDAAVYHHLQANFLDLRYVLGRLWKLNQSNAELGLVGAAPVQRPLTPHRVWRQLRWALDVAERVARGDDWQPLFEALGALARRRAYRRISGAASNGK